MVLLYFLSFIVTLFGENNFNLSHFHFEIKFK